MTTTSAQASGGSPRRMTFVASFLQEVGGVEQLLLDLVMLAGRDGWEVLVVAPRRLDPGGSLARALSAHAELVTAESCWQRRPTARVTRIVALARDLVRRRRWPDRRRRASLGGERARPYLDRFWSSAEGRRALERAAVVHVLGAHPFGARAIAAAGDLGVPVVYTATATVTAEGAVDPYHRPFVDALGAVTVATTHSSRAAEELARHYGYEGPIRVIDQWLDPHLEDQLLGLAPAPASPGSAPLVVGSLSRLADGKGLAALLDAVGRAVRDGADLRLVVGGDGPARAALTGQAEALGPSARVEFRGAVEADDRATFLGGLDVFAMTSVAETGPLNGLEAMAAARAVLTTPVGAMPDRLHHRRDAWFCGVDDVEALARALAALAEDRREVARLAAGARAAYLERNRADHLGAVVQGLWREVAGPASGRPD